MVRKRDIKNATTKVKDEVIVLPDATGLLVRTTSDSGRCQLIRYPYCRNPRREAPTSPTTTWTAFLGWYFRSLALVVLKFLAPSSLVRFKLFQVSVLVLALYHLKERWACF
ncbi:hypothetical protein BHE74_00004960 [Ensete ventricosum]|uniref:Uncharacterized protein n=1 Tax=Ensete ventricosum TaxID=4639 RepID=A0A444G6Q4_ENSVE|nr:hypothetical protein GW17_00004834 [Ensete ventricosum]RWW86276.1 hypothetical protein BHE74_00004960 [Ensete ventricosum]RZR70441.1 hypothetical protein BHM03_00000047 [Ensete ventricosum]